RSLQPDRHRRAQMAGPHDGPGRLRLPERRDLVWRVGEYAKAVHDQGRLLRPENVRLQRETAWVRRRYGNTELEQREVPDRSWRAPGIKHIRHIGGYDRQRLWRIDSYKNLRLVVCEAEAVLRQCSDLTNFRVQGRVVGGHHHERVHYRHFRP